MTGTGDKFPRVEGYTVASYADDWESARDTGGHL